MLVLAFSLVLPIILKHKKIVFHKKTKITFFIPTRLLYYRADTFSQKEPETLAWIDTFQKNSVFWDIGANVGLYSIYPVKTAATTTTTANTFELRCLQVLHVTTTKEAEKKNEYNEKGDAKKLS